MPRLPAVILLVACIVLASCGGDDSGDVDQPGTTVSDEEIAAVRSDGRFIERARKRCRGVRVPAPARRGASPDRPAAAAERRADALRRQAARLRAAGAPAGGAEAVSELRDMLIRAAEVEDRIARATRSYPDAVPELREHSARLEREIERRARRLGIPACAR